MLEEPLLARARSDSEAEVLIEDQVRAPPRTTSRKKHENRAKNSFFRVPLLNGVIPHHRRFHDVTGGGDEDQNLLGLRSPLGGRDLHPSGALLHPAFNPPITVVASSSRAPLLTSSRPNAPWGPPSPSPPCSA
jgi:hypothetical protein